MYRSQQEDNVQQMSTDFEPRLWTCLLQRAVKWLLKVKQLNKQLNKLEYDDNQNAGGALCYFWNAKVNGARLCFLFLTEILSSILMVTL